MNKLAYNSKIGSFKFLFEILKFINIIINNEYDLKESLSSL